MKQFPTNPRVIERLDDLNHPCGFDVVMTIPATAAEPEHDEYICSLPDGLSPQQRQMAELIAAIPVMLDLLGVHCDHTCDFCDWRHEPEQQCPFGQLWKKLGLSDPSDQSDRSVAHVPFVQTEESTPFDV